MQIFSGLASEMPSARLKPCPDTCMGDGCGMAVQADVGRAGGVEPTLRKKREGLGTHEFVKTEKAGHPPNGLQPCPTRLRLACPTVTEQKCVTKSVLVRMVCR